MVFICHIGDYNLKLVVVAVEEYIEDKFTCTFVCSAKKEKQNSKKIREFESSKK